MERIKITDSIGNTFDITEIKEKKWLSLRELVGIIIDHGTHSYQFNGGRGSCEFQYELGTIENFAGISASFYGDGYSMYWIHYGRKNAYHICMQFDDLGNKALVEDMEWALNTSGLFDEYREAGWQKAGGHV